MPTWFWVDRSLGPDTVTRLGQSGGRPTQGEETMGQLHRLFAKSSPAHQRELVDSVATIIGVDGLGGLVLRFAASGFGPQVESWIRVGPNQRLSSRQLRAVVGDDELSKIASDSDVPPKQVAQGLAILVPRAIDRLTPEGTVPTSAALRRSLGQLNGLLAAS